MSTPIFSIGDEVRIVGKTAKRCGEVGTVVGVRCYETRDPLYIVEFSCGRKGSYFASELRAADAPPTLFEDFAATLAEVRTTGLLS